MLFKLTREGQETRFYWQRSSDWAHVYLGNGFELTAIYEALDAWLMQQRPIRSLPCPPPDEPEFYTVPEAVSAAQGLDADKRRFSETIRSAARAGRITGAYRTPEGYWRLPVAAFNAWLAEHAEQRRGRPRKEAAAETKTAANDLDLYHRETSMARMLEDREW